VNANPINITTNKHSRAPTAPVATTTALRLVACFENAVADGVVVWSVFECSSRLVERVSKMMVLTVEMGTALDTNELWVSVCAICVCDIGGACVETRPIVVEGIEVSNFGDETIDSVITAAVLQHISRSILSRNSCEDGLFDPLLLS
jgi:hypothetical protein